MICPKCGSHHAKFNHRRTDLTRDSIGRFRKDPRVDFSARCRACGWEGIIKEVKK